MTKLYQLSAEYAELQRLAEDGCDVEGALATISDAIEHKAEGIFAVQAGLSADADALRNEIRRLKKRLDAIEANRERLSNYVRDCMIGAGIDRIKGPRFTAYVRENQAAVIVVDEAAIPSEYKTEVKSTSVNKLAIREAVEKHGEVIPGVELTRSKSVIVK